jgi:hypothetical protein
MAMAWLHGPEAIELAEAIVDYVGAVPVRRKQEAPVGSIAPGHLGEAVEAMAAAQAAFSSHEPKSLRRVQRATLRCRAWLGVLAGGPDLGREKLEAAAAIDADLEALAERLEALRRLDAADEHLGVFLDRWAVRQARRKAPQLHGAEAVLALRQVFRAERTQQQRALSGAWRPVRGRQLRRRVAQLLRGTVGTQRE